MTLDNDNAGASMPANGSLDATTPEHKTALQPNIADAAKHLNWLAPEGAFTFQTFNDIKGHKAANVTRILHGNLNQHAKNLFELNQQGAGVFVTVNQTDGKGRAEGNITGIRGLFVDFDTERARRLEELKTLDKNHAGALLPSLIIESSTGKHHAYWIAEGLPLEQFTHWQTLLIEWFTGLGDAPDKAIKDKTRVMRLAGFSHMKGEPILTRIVYTGTRYTADQIAEFIRLIEGDIERPPVTTPDGRLTLTTNSPFIVAASGKNTSQFLSSDGGSFEQVKTRAQGNWRALLAQLGIKVPDDPRQHGPCPACGGTDRFRFDDKDGHGTWLCGQGGAGQIAGDGFNLLEHMGLNAADALLKVRNVVMPNYKPAHVQAKAKALPAEAVQAQEWGTPEPLTDIKQQATRYPVEAFTGVLRDAVEAIAYHAQVPLAMAGQCVLGALSAMGQKFVNAPMGHSFKPTSLFLITEGESGAGKTEANKYSHHSIINHDEKAAQRFDEEYTAWEQEKNSLRGEELTDFLKMNPAPANGELTITDATIEGALDTFILLGHTDLAWTVDEAAMFFNGHSMKSDTAGNALSSLTKLWSNGVAKRQRSPRGPNAVKKTSAYNVRLTLDIMGQRVILEPALNDPMMNGQGFLPRCLIACPDSLIGTRQWNTPERMNSSPYDDPRLQAYWKQCDILLDPFPSEIPIDEQGRRTRLNMPFSDFEARKALADYQQEIEQRQASGRLLEFYRAHASRMAENASRIATLMAYFDYKTTLSADYLKRAFLLVEYSMAERLRYVEVAPSDQSDSQKLVNWLVKQFKVKNIYTMSYAEAQSNVNPKGLRLKATFELATAVLCDKHQIKVTQVNNSRFIVINPILLA